jgi:hypothetical protein
VRTDPLIVDDVHRQLADSIARCCTRQGGATRAGSLDPGLWRGIAEIGVFELGHAGRASDVVAAGAALGRHGAYGPLAATLLAAALPELCGAPDAALVAAGSTFATIACDAAGDRSLVPWGPLAGVVLAIDERCTTVAVAEQSSVQEVVSMSGEQWGRARLDVGPSVPLAIDLLARCWLANAAWMIGAATDAIDALHDYLHHRRQFGRPLADFQAVSHPVAEAGVTLVASAAAVARAAERLDHDGDCSPAAAACVGAGPAALDATLIAHQAYGAIAFIEEGPLGMLAPRVREMASAPPAGGRLTGWLAAHVLDGAGGRLA